MEPPTDERRRRPPGRPWELLPELALAIGLGAFLLTEPDAATSALRSPRALALMAGTATAWLAARAALGRLPRRWRPIRTGLFGLAAAAVLTVVVLPAYDDTTVVEVLAPERLDPAATSAPDPAPVTTTSAPAEPVVLRSGALRGIDHRASGTARLYRQPSGRQVVGLEDIDIQPGPDYDVFLVPGRDRDQAGDGIRLDDLRGNKGSQFYDLPDATDAGVGAWTVLVWCQTFGVPVAAATLS